MGSIEINKVNKFHQKLALDIKQMVEVSGMTSKQIGDKLGKSARTVERIYYNERMTTTTLELICLAQILGKTLEIKFLDN